MNEIKTFEERKNELVKKGKEKGFITYEELANALKGLDLDSDSLDELYNLFNENNIAIVSEDDDTNGNADKLLLDDNDIILMMEQNKDVVKGMVEHAADSSEFTSKLESMLKGNKKNNENLKNLCAFLDIEIGETK